MTARDVSVRRKRTLGEGVLIVRFRPEKRLFSSIRNFSAQKLFFKEAKFGSEFHSPTVFEALNRLPKESFVRHLLANEPPHSDYSNYQTQQWTFRCFSECRIIAPGAKVSIRPRNKTDLGSWKAFFAPNKTDLGPQKTFFATRKVFHATKKTILVAKKGVLADEKTFFASKKTFRALQITFFVTKKNFFVSPKVGSRRRETTDYTDLRI
jgi:hypothetical protein